MEEKSMKIRCIAVDDEPLALEKMETFIEKIDYLDLVDRFDNGMDALNFLRKEEVDLVFLDIQMDELSGIQLLEVLKVRPKVILTTAYDEYALKGYELDVADYLLKPFSFQRFLKAVEKVYDQLKSARSNPAEAPSREKRRPYLLVRSEYKLIKIWLDEILFVEGMKDYSRIHCTERRIMTMQNLKKMEGHLPHPAFLRVHKSYIIPVEKIDSIDKNHLQIREHSIPIGGLYKKSLLDYLDSQQLL
jgi:two-component system LytT family response regulator